MANRDFYDDANGMAFIEQKTGEEPLYIYVPYGFADIELGLRTFTAKLRDNEINPSGRMMTVRVRLKGRDGRDFKLPLSVPESFLATGDFIQMLVGSLPDGYSLKHVLKVKVSFWRRDSQVVDPITKLENTLSRGIAEVKNEIADVKIELIRLTNRYNGDYTRAAQELKIPIVQAYSIVREHMN